MSSLVININIIKQLAVIIMNTFHYAKEGLRHQIIFEVSSNCFNIVISLMDPHYDASNKIIEECNQTLCILILYVVYSYQYKLFIIYLEMRRSLRFRRFIYLCNQFQLYTWVTGDRYDTYRDYANSYMSLSRGDIFISLRIL